MNIQNNWNFDVFHENLDVLLLQWEDYDIYLKLVLQNHVLTIHILSAIKTFRERVARKKLQIIYHNWSFLICIGRPRVS